MKIRERLEANIVQKFLVGYDLGFFLFALLKIFQNLNLFLHLMVLYTSRNGNIRRTPEKFKIMEKT